MMTIKGKEYKDQEFGSFHCNRLCIHQSPPIRSVCSTVPCRGNLKLIALGNFNSTLGIDAGMAFTLGERRFERFDGEGARELTALFESDIESSRSGKWSVSICGEELFGTIFDELVIVDKSGLRGCSSSIDPAKCVRRDEGTVS